MPDIRGIPSLAAMKQDECYWVYVLTDTRSNIEVSDWSISSEDLGLSLASRFSVTKRTLCGGKQQGSTTLTVETDAIRVTVIPTRGMSVLNAIAGDIALGWASPVDEIVHPGFIDLERRGGTGWLDGFNEFMVRCGFESTGQPSIEDGKLFTLHGRSGNTPASTVLVQIEKAHPHEIRLLGLVKEKTFKFADFEAWTSLSVVPGTAGFEVHDSLANRADYAREYQVIYHSNYGPPLLEAGARLIAPVKELSPFNEIAVNGLDDWDRYPGPTPDYVENLFNCDLQGDESGQTFAALVNAEANRGVAMRYSLRQLPCLTLWKKADTLRQGYVTGIEPGTNHPYPRSCERGQGRVRLLQPQEICRFDLIFEVLATADDIKRLEAEVERIMGENVITTNTTPKYLRT